MLTKIFIENFKGIGSPGIEIELKPITLFFGANSAGKSTVIQAINLLRYIVFNEDDELADVSPRKPNISIGDYYDYVYNHDINRDIKIRIEFEIESSSTVTENSRLIDDINSFHLIKDLSKKIKSGIIEVVLRYNKKDNCAEIIHYRAGYNSKLLCGLKWEDPTYLDFIHIKNIYEILEGNNTIADNIENILNIILKYKLHEYNYVVEKYKKNDISDDAVKDYFNLIENEIKELNYSISSIIDVLEFLQKYNLDILFDDSIEIDSFSTLVFKNFILEDPYIDMIPKFALLFEYHERDFFDYNLIYFLLEVPKNIIMDFLKRSIHIGPIREIPPRDFRPQRKSNYGRWYHGLEAWDILINRPWGLSLQKINNSLLALEAGYQIKIKEYYEIEQHDKLWNDLLSLENNNNITSIKDNIKILIEEKKSLTKRNKIVYTPKLNPDLELQANDLGIGISQLIPIVVANEYHSSFIIIEQPELHIHPAIQVEIADLFIDGLSNGYSKKQYLIETHSEHIMLRMLRRIEETTKRKSQHKENLHLKPEDLSVLFFEQTENGVKVTHLPVDETGEFTEQWPKGFFEERAEELFPTYDENEEND
jgi:predicted ATPase